MEGEKLTTLDKKIKMIDNNFAQVAAKMAEMDNKLVDLDAYITSVGEGLIKLTAIVDKLVDALGGNK